MNKISIFKFSAMIILISSTFLGSSFADEAEFLESIANIKILQGIQWNNSKDMQRLSKHFWNSLKGGDIGKRNKDINTLKEGPLNIEDIQLEIVFIKSQKNISNPYYFIIRHKFALIENYYKKVTEDIPYTTEDCDRIALWMHNK